MCIYCYCCLLHPAGPVFSSYLTVSFTASTPYHLMPLYHTTTISIILDPFQPPS